MLNPTDLNSYRETFPLKDTAGKIHGQAILHYQIKRYKDLTKLGSDLKYQILGTIRVIVPNAETFVLGPVERENTNQKSGFRDYPASVSCQASITTPSGGSIKSHLVEYIPKTLNSSVNISHSDVDGSNKGVTLQHSSGSSTSTTNTFGISATLGFMADIPTGSVTADYSHSGTSGVSQSSSIGGNTNTSREASSGSAMTVKDWQCNTQIDTGGTTPTWFWGQEYPWNVLLFNNAGTPDPDSSDPIILPSYVRKFLAGSENTLPPSDLSLYGVDFTMKALWLVEPDASNCITLNHTIGIGKATHHRISAGKVNAYLHKPISFSPSISSMDLISYALDSLSSSRTGYSSVVGFVPSKFLTQPTAVSITGTAKKPVLNVTKFMLVSAYNDLYLYDSSTYSAAKFGIDDGAGFSTDQGGMTATFTPNINELQITAVFKITDQGGDYTLHLKHWKLDDTGFVLDFVFNGDEASKVTRYVDAKEAEGGDQNALSIDLRNRDFASVDFHDYLVLGKNTVTISIRPISIANCSYKIRALAISRN